MTDEPVQLTTEGVSAAGLDYNGMRSGDVAELRARLNEVQAENVHLRGLLRLTPEQARQPGPSQTAIFDKSPGAVSGSSELHAKCPSTHGCSVRAKTCTRCGGTTPGPVRVVGCPPWKAVSARGFAPPTGVTFH